MAELRAATWPAHQRLERRLRVKERFADRIAYRSYLEKLWGFCAGLERSLSSASFAAALPDYEARRKLPLLTCDLVALGRDSRQLSLLPQRPGDTAPDVAAAFGCLYVFEGATLGGRTLLPLVEEQLGLTADHGASFLASYRADVTAMWRRFGAALDSWCCQQERRASAVRAAVTTFDDLAEWLCGSPA